MPRKIPKQFKVGDRVEFLTTRNNGGVGAVTKVRAGKRGVWYEILEEGLDKSGALTVTCARAGSMFLLEPKETHVLD